MVTNLTEVQYIEGMLKRSQAVLSKEDVERIKNTTFALAGFGGVGSIVAELLARWGVKKFRLFDKDKYDLTNLNRQLFCTSQTIGESKVEATARRIKEINPYAEIEMKIIERSNYENTERFVNGADFIIQTTDQPSSQLFYIAARKYKVPLVNAYASLTGCTLTFFDYKHSNCYHWIDKLKDNIKWKNMKPIIEMTNQELDELDKKWNPGSPPSFNFITNLCGCLLVAEAFKYITGKGKACHYPRSLELNIINWKLKITNSFSPFNKKNIKKIFKYII